MKNASICLLLGLVATMATADEPVLKATFEEDGLPAGVSVTGGAQGQIVSTCCHEGKKSLRVTGRTQEWNGVQMDLTGKVREGCIYSLMAWVRQETKGETEFRIFLRTVDGSGDHYDIITSAAVPRGKWVLLQGEVRVGGGLSAFQPYVECDGLDPFLVDDLCCAPLAFRVPLQAPEDPSPRADLAAAVGKRFLVGTALGAGLFTRPSASELAAITNTFNAVTPENEMKPASIHPEPGRYEFGAADALVDFCTRHHLKVIGHCLVWTEQTPHWMNRTADGQPLPREKAIANMREHIQTVMGRYKGRIEGWDVVNEAFDDWGNLRQDSFWLKSIGPDYIELAFRFAMEADPSAKLYYNDFGMHGVKKSSAVCAMVKSFRKKGIRIDAVGMQSHQFLGWPTVPSYERSIKRFAAVGVKVCITEMDVSVLPSAWGLSADITRHHDYHEKFDPYRAGLPEEIDRRLSQQYRELFAMYLDNAKTIDRVTVWGLHDGQSWLNYIPINGRVDYPLFYDRACQPKKALTDTVRLVRKYANRNKNAKK